MEINKVYLGDCSEVLKTLPENSIDSIVTDPPYHLVSIVKRFGSEKARNTPAMNTKEGGVFARKAKGFMGKEWDGVDENGMGIAMNKDMWAECLRVLKPGGHLLAFSGTRTYHRMASAIEDAGFEVRDMIEWVYASGFPKSHNVRLNIDKQYDILKDIWLKSNVSIAPEFSIVAHPISSGEFFVIEPVAPSSQQQEQNVKYVIKNSLKRTAKSKIQGITIAEECVKDLLRESLVDKIKGEEAQKTLLGKWLSSKETDINANFAELIESLKLTILNKLETFPNYDTSLQMEYVFVINATTTESIKECLITNTADILKELNHKLHNGIGSALKPAHEPICFARKPLEKGLTIAENCLKWGTGGINIDESRVAHQSEEDRLSATPQGKVVRNNFKPGETPKGTETERPDTSLGRFPANLIHDNSEEVRECFPATGASKKRLLKDIEGDSNGEVFKKSGYSRKAGGVDDNGGNASRFFKSIIYQAKASKSDRGQGNIHPTVKNTALMEYLIKMVTPKGGLVLDPFAGSGSTLVAAKQNGYQYIGIELTAEYIPIIEARLSKEKNTLF